jgi:hypothetical protein
VEKFKCFGTTATNQNGIHAEMKSRLNSGNECYHFVQNLLSSRLLFKNVLLYTSCAQNYRCGLVRCCHSNHWFAPTAVSFGDLSGDAFKNAATAVDNVTSSPRDRTPQPSFSTVCTCAFSLSGFGEDSGG